MSKILQKLLVKKIVPIFQSCNSIPGHQFGFSPQHSTIQEYFSDIETILLAAESRSYCTSAFLDVAQEFGRDWQAGLLYRVKRLLPHT